jgi:hypothetical protein
MVPHMQHKAAFSFSVREHVGVYRVIVLLVFCYQNLYLVLEEYWESIGRILGELHRQQTDGLVVGDLQTKLVCTQIEVE